MTTTANQSRYAHLPIFEIEDATRGGTFGRIPRRDLHPAPHFTMRMVTLNWSVDYQAHLTQGSAYAWWKIMDTNPEYLHPWEIQPGDVVRLPTLR